MNRIEFQWKLILNLLSIQNAQNAHCTQSNEINQMKKCSSIVCFFFFHASVQAELPTNAYAGGEDSVAYSK